ncbi:MAG: hypothetical protein Q8842_02160, partial [Candidatus Phytoplasma australasiaticum]|nr:hypothetical protein [Candidatus Phytoplasma australasiaticum]
RDLHACRDTLFRHDSLPFLNEIQLLKKRHAEIQKEIEEVDQKLAEINLEKELYQVLKLKYREMYNRMITYEKENEASAGNITNGFLKVLIRLLTYSLLNLV